MNKIRTGGGSYSLSLLALITAISTGAQAQRARPQSARANSTRISGYNEMNTGDKLRALKKQDAEAAVSWNKGSAHVKTMFGEVACPLFDSMSPKKMHADIWLKDANTIKLKPEQKIPLNQLVNKEALRKYTSAVGNDMYIYIGDAFNYKIGANECHIGILRTGQRCNETHSSAVALNPENLDSYELVVGDAHSIRVNMITKVPVVGFIAGEDPACAGFGNLVGDTRDEATSLSTQDAYLNLDISGILAGEASEAALDLEKFNTAVAKCDAVSAKVDAIGVSMGVNLGAGIASTLASGASLAGNIASHAKPDNAFSGAVNNDKLVGGMGINIIGTVGGVAGTVSSGIGLGKLLPELKDAVKECQDAVKALN
ncbi:MAG: hypothetical protein LBL52_00740 [Rickettsiales bacterium]|nr:hypothetical protein [Rickettsiales bacterium]